MSYTADAKVLTPDGWRYIHQINTTDQLAILNQGVLDFAHPIAVESRNYSGDVVLCGGRNLAWIVTPDHVCHGIRDGDDLRVTAAQLLDPYTPNQTINLRAAATLGKRDREVSDVMFAKLAGLLRANIMHMHRNHIRSRLQVMSIRNYLLSLLRECGIPFTIESSGVLLHKHPRLMVYFNSYDRLRRSTALMLDTESKRALIQGAMSWRQRLKKPAYPTNILRFPPEEVELIHEICALAGLASAERKMKHGFQQVKIRPNQTGWAPRMTCGTYKGRVYSLTMPTQNVLTRISGRPTITGDGSEVGKPNLLPRTSGRRLTSEWVKEIKRRIARGDRVVDIAEDYPVDVVTIQSIKEGRTYK